MPDDPYPPPIETELPNGQDFSVQVGGIGIRFVAYLIDLLPIVLATAGIFYMILGFDGTLLRYWTARGDFNARVEFLRQRNQIRDLSFVIYIVYCALTEGSPMQGTIGKRLLGLRVSDDNGHRLTLVRSFGRNMAKIVSYIPFGLGFFWALWSKRNRGWHDMLAKTLVIKSR